MKRDGKYGIINTSGELLCDFVYNEIIVCSKDVAIVKFGNSQAFYYVNSKSESEFAASSISPLKDNYFNTYTWGGTHGVIDSYGNMLLPNRTLRAIEGNNAIAYQHLRSNAFDSPPTIYYNKDFEVVCYEMSGGRLDSDGKYVFFAGVLDKDENVIWNDFHLNTLTISMGGFKNVYVIQNNSSGIEALAAINEIPQPMRDVGGKYISIMFNNPLVNIGGRTRTIEEKNYFYTPVVRDGWIFLPYELLGELGMQTSWDEGSQAVIAVMRGKQMVLKMDSHEAYLDGDILHLDVPAQIIDGRILVPYETVAVALGASGYWDGANNTLTLFFE